MYHYLSTLRAGGDDYAMDCNVRVYDCFYVTKCEGEKYVPILKGNNLCFSY